MQTQAVDAAMLPPFSNQRGCPRCGARYEIRVHFDRDCAEARGDHFHRICVCGHRWLERASATAPDVRCLAGEDRDGDGPVGRAGTMGVVFVALPLARRREPFDDPAWLYELGAVGRWERFERGRRR